MSAHNMRTRNAHGDAGQGNRTEPLPHIFHTLALRARPIVLSYMEGFFSSDDARFQAARTPAVGNQGRVFARVATAYPCKGIGTTQAVHAGTLPSLGPQRYGPDGTVYSRSSRLFGTERMVRFTLADRWLCLFVAFRGQRPGAAWWEAASTLICRARRWLVCARLAVAGETPALRVGDWRSGGWLLGGWQLQARRLRYGPPLGAVSQS